MEHIFVQVAAKYHTTPEAVRKGIEEMIDECSNSNDPRIRAKWRAMSKNGRKPTPEEFIASCSLKLLSRPLASVMLDRKNIRNP